MEIKYVPTITCDEVSELIGKHWSECEFAQMVADGSYVIVYLDQDAFDIIDEDLEWEERKDSLRFNRLINQKELMVKLRDEYGLTDKILIGVNW